MTRTVPVESISGSASARGLPRGQHPDLLEQRGAELADELLRAREGVALLLHRGLVHADL